MKNTFSNQWMQVQTILLLSLLLACKPKDAEIAKSVESKVSSLSQNVTVEVKDGVVTLSGDVEDSTLRASIEGNAQGVLGVKSVINNIQLREPSEKALRTPDEISKSVEESLRTMNIQGVTVEVDTSGTATISGYAEISQDSTIVSLVKNAGARKVIDQLKFVK